MKLTLAHETPTLHSTPGRMMCDDGWCCFTMEIGPPVPPGHYEVVTAYSAELMQPLLAFRREDGKIMGFIHPGGGKYRHAYKHIMLGMDRVTDLVVDSLRAYRELDEKVSEAGRADMFDETVTIEIQPFQQHSHEPS